MLKKGEVGDAGRHLIDAFAHPQQRLLTHVA
jgi:hypothetical protein